jgi:excisionase family DNA binding protein
VAQEILTAAETAEYLRVPLKTLYAWRHRGSAPQAFRAGRHLRFRRSDLDSWLEERIAEQQPGR